MDLLPRIIDLFLHLDRHLGQLISQYGTWTHLILFLIVLVAADGLDRRVLAPGS